MRKMLIVAIGVFCLVGLAMAQSTLMNALTVLSQYDAKLKALQEQHDKGVADAKSRCLADLKAILATLKGDDPQVDFIKAKMKELEGPPKVSLAKAVVGTTYLVRMNSGVPWEITFGKGAVVITGLTSDVNRLGHAVNIAPVPPNVGTYVVNEPNEVVVTAETSSLSVLML